LAKVKEKAKRKGQDNVSIRTLLLRIIKGLNLKNILSI